VLSKVGHTLWQRPMSGDVLCYRQYTVDRTCINTVMLLVE